MSRQDSSSSPAPSASPASSRNLRSFRLTADHLALLRLFNVAWQYCETGAPEIDPKRPYGNSGVALDVAEALGWDVGEEMSADMRERAMGLHFETHVAMEIVLQHAGSAVEPGVYRNVSEWRPYGGPQWSREAGPS